MLKSDTVLQAVHLVTEQLRCEEPSQIILTEFFRDATHTDQPCIRNRTSRLFRNDNRQPGCRTRRKKELASTNCQLLPSDLYLFGSR